MERRPVHETNPRSPTETSGVFPAVSKQHLAHLHDELRALSERASAFRADVLSQPGTRDASVGMRALEEIDVAHEELRVVEEELHAQADEIATVRETLDSERRRYTELFEAAPDAYVVTDANGNVIEANRRAGHLLKVDPLFLARKPLVTFVAPSDRSKFRDLVGGILGGRVETELRIQPRKGERALWVSVTAEPALGTDRSAAIRWMVRSIDGHKTELEEARDRVRELEASNEHLERLLEEEQEARHTAGELAHKNEAVLSEVAHELRSPLGSIAGWLHVLTNAQAEPGTHLRAFLSMTRSVRSLARLVEDLIEHARFAHHTVRLNLTTVNFVRILIDVIEDLRPIADLKNVALGFNAHPYKIEASADAWRLGQVFRNVIGNAIKFTPENGVVNVNIRVFNKQAVITVSDTGRGIEQNLLATIFEPFAQVLKDGSRAHAHVQGLGLGLSIAKRFVELHGGTIRAESEGADMGTTMRIVLPLLAPN